MEEKTEAIRRIQKLVELHEQEKISLNQWETGFILGLGERLETYGNDIFLSEKQIAKIDDIFLDKICSIEDEEE